LNFFKDIPVNSKEYRQKLSEVLGFKPKNIQLYLLACTHKSVESISGASVYHNNERLEFLGDAVLDAAVSDLLYKRFPTADEGFLTKMRTKIVNGKTLTELTKKIGLDKLLFVKSQKNLTERIFEDAFEALIAAIYLDKGYEYVIKFVSQQIMVEHINLNRLKYVDTNYKSKIIEWSQKHKLNVEFETIENAEDNIRFVSNLKVNDISIAEGTGQSKKTAEQEASKSALDKIKSGDFTLKV
jgi:ribonuclease-3